MRKALGIAAVSALSALCDDVCPGPDHPVVRGVDAVDLLTIQESGNVVVVGALTPYLRALKQAGQPFRVLEMDPRTLKPDELPFYTPVEETDMVVPWADTLVITGTTLINGTLDHLLELARPEATVVVLGPSVSILPDALFSRGVEIVGGNQVTDPDRLLDILAEGGSGYHFFGKGADRIAVRRSQDPRERTGGGRGRPLLRGDNPCKSTATSASREKDWFYCAEGGYAMSVPCEGD